jgi:hypothetical protein
MGDDLVHQVVPSPPCTAGPGSVGLGLVVSAMGCLRSGVCTLIHPPGRFSAQWLGENCRLSHPHQSVVKNLCVVRLIVKRLSCVICLNY